MALPHYSQDQTSRKGSQWEPVQANLFEVTIIPPSGVKGAPLLLQHVNSIGGLDLYKEVAEVTQKYKFATRSYAKSAPDSTTVDLAVQELIHQLTATKRYPRQQ